MALGVGLEWCGKSRPPPPEFDAWTIRPVAIDSTDYAKQYYDKITETKSVIAMRSNNL